MKKPLGIYLIIVYFLLAILGILQSISLYLTTSIPTIPIFGVFQAPKIVGLLLLVVITCVYAVCIYGLYNAKKWGFLLTLGLQAYSIIGGILGLAFVDTITSTAIKTAQASSATPLALAGMEGIMKTAILASMAIGIIISIAIAYYIYKKKEYFTNK